MIVNQFYLFQILGRGKKLFVKRVCNDKKRHDILRMMQLELIPLEIKQAKNGVEIG